MFVAGGGYFVGVRQLDGAVWAEVGWVRGLLEGCGAGLMKWAGAAVVDMQ